MSVPVIRILDVAGDLTGQIKAIDALGPGPLEIGGNVTAAATIEIADFDNGRILLGAPSDPDVLFEGALTLLSGLPISNVVTIYAETTASAAINLAGALAGEIHLIRGGEAQISSSGSLTGLLRLSFVPPPTESRRFDGVVSVPSVGALGRIEAITGGIGGVIEVSGNLAGTILFDGAELDGNGTISVAGNVATTGHIVFQQNDSFLRGSLRGRILVEGEMLGRIRIDGSLLDGEFDHEIVVSGSLGTTGAVTIDFDGWHAQDFWEEGALVSVDGEEYAENAPAARVWEVTECKGDMNNDGSLDYFDIDPFLLALFDPDGFAEAFPGLGKFGGTFFGEVSPMGYHGNFEADCELIDFFDTDPFSAAVVNSCCFNECPAPTCESFGGQSAEDWADLIEAHVDPARITALVELIGSTESFPAGRQDFWEDVAAELED